MAKYYDSEGKEVSLTQEEEKELTEALSKLNTSESASVTKKEPSWGEYLADRAKGGVSQALKMGIAAGNALGQVPKLGFNYFYPENAKPIDNPLEIAQKGAEPLDKLLGYKGLQSEDMAKRAVGGAVANLTDPTTYLLGPGNLLTKAATSVVPGATSELGGMVGERVGGTLGGIVGSIFGGIGGASAQNSAMRLGGGAFKAASSFKNARSLAEEKIGFQASQHMQTTLEAAIKADPKILDTITILQKQSEALGTPMPLTSLMNNPVIQAQLIQLAEKDPLFSAALRKAYDEAQNALSYKAAGVFGDPIDAKSVDMGNLRITQLDNRVKDLTTTAQAVSKEVSPFYAGNSPREQLKKLLTVSEGDISPKSRPMYIEADNIASVTNAKLSKGSVEEIYKLVGSEKAENIFQRFPSLLNKVREQWSPATVSSPVSYQEGFPLTGKAQFKEVPYKDVRSLQTEISNEYRKLNPNSATYRQDRDVLSTLRRALDSAIQKDFPEKLTTKLKDASTQYAYDANVREFSRAVMDDRGILDPKKAIAWLKDEGNQRMVTSLKEPGTTDVMGVRLNKTTDVVASILARKEEVSGLHTKMLQQKIMDTAGMSPSEIVKKMETDDKFVSQVLKQYPKESKPLKALQAFALDDILNSPTPLVDLLKDKNKASMYNRVFGPGYTKVVEELATIANTLKTDPNKIRFNVEKGVSKDLLQEFTNVPASQMFSKLRNPIMSKWQALMELGSKSLTERANNEYERQMKELFLNPDKLKEFIAAVKPVNGAIEPDRLFSFAKKNGLPYILTEAEKARKSVFKGSVQGASIGVSEAVATEKEKK